MIRFLVGKVAAVLGFCTVLSMLSPQAFGFWSNRVVRHSDGCVNQNAQRETEKVQRKREKVAFANLHGRLMAAAYRGSLR